MRNDNEKFRRKLTLKKMQIIKHIGKGDNFGLDHPWEGFGSVLGIQKLRLKEGLDRIEIKILNIYDRKKY